MNDAAAAWVARRIHAREVRTGRMERQWGELTHEEVDQKVADVQRRAAGTSRRVVETIERGVATGELA